MTRLYRGPYDIARKRPRCPDCDRTTRLKGDYWYCGWCGQRVARWNKSAKEERETARAAFPGSTPSRDVPVSPLSARRAKTTGVIPGQGQLFELPPAKEVKRGRGSQRPVDAEVIARRAGPLAPRQQDNPAP